MARDFFDELSDTITRTTKDLGKKAGQLYDQLDQRVYSGGAIYT